jgi:hypothetical protein
MVWLLKQNRCKEAQLLNSIGQEGPCSGIDFHAGQELPVIEVITTFLPQTLIEEVLDQTGRREKRRRRLPASTVVWLLVMLGVRSDLDLPSMWRQVCGVIHAMLHRLGGVNPPAKSALSQARARLGARPLRQLLLRTGRRSGIPSGQAYTHYKGMPMVAMDGDKYKLPDTPANSAAFGRPSTSRGDEKLDAGYPQMHVNRLMAVGTRICIDVIVKPCNTNDHTSAPALLRSVLSGELVFWDCGFYSFGLMERACAENKFFLGPVPSHAVLRPIRKLGDGSYLVKAYATPNDRRDDRGGVLLRAIEDTLDEPARVGHGERHRLITNLLDEVKHPAMELVVLYHQRWEIEIANDEITTHQLDRAVELRSRTPAGAVQEIHAVLLAHNAVRSLMLQSAMRIGIDPRTLSFINSVRIVREMIQTMREAPTKQLPLLYRGMLQQIAAARLPARDGRINPRVVKVVRPSNFPVKKSEHRNWPRPKKTFEQSVVMLN